MRTTAIRKTVTLATLACVFATASAACGTSNGEAPSSFVAPSEADAGAPDSGAAVGSFDDGGLQIVGFDTACATSAAAAVPRPAYLVYMFDRSGSMANNAKWQTVTSSMKAFFADARTLGMNASLQFFPLGGEDVMCLSDYSQAAVEMRPLPDGQTFAAALDATSPDGRTPTVPALHGAIAYAEKVYAEHGQDGKVAVIFVTDGNPDGCDSDVPKAGAEAQSVANHISTHVIGIGQNLSSLNFIAKRGGTTQALLVSDADPATTASALVDAMDSVTRAALSCEYGIPAPKGGEVINYMNVNVIHTTGDGAGHALTYDSICDLGSAGWHYDDVHNPARVILCPAACDAVVADRRSKIDVLFGCATQGDIK